MPKLYKFFLDNELPFLSYFLTFIYEFIISFRKETVDGKYGMCLIGDDRVVVGSHGLKLLDREDFVEKKSFVGHRTCVSQILPLISEKSSNYFLSSAEEDALIYLW